MLIEEYCKVHAWDGSAKKWVLIASARTYFEVDLILSSPGFRKYQHFQVSREVPKNVQEWRYGVDDQEVLAARKKPVINADSDTERTRQEDRGSSQDVSAEQGLAGTGTVPCPWD